MQIPKQLLREIASIENRGAIVLTVHTNGKDGWALKIERTKRVGSDNPGKSKRRAWRWKDNTDRETINFDPQTIELIDLKGIGNIY